MQLLALLAIWFMLCLIVLRRPPMWKYLDSNGFLLYDNNDSDIKIAGDHPSKGMRILPEEPSEELALLLVRQRENGNLDRAREIGRRTAFDLCNFRDYRGETDQLVKEQMRILYAFTVAYGLGESFPNPLLAETATNEYMMTFKSVDEDYYDLIQISGAYSMYVLCSRNPLEMEVTIGGVFAKLCQHEGEVDWERKGSQYFAEWLKGINDRMSHYVFVD